MISVLFVIAPVIEGSTAGLGVTLKFNDDGIEAIVAYGNNDADVK